MRSAFSTLVQIVAPPPKNRDAAVVNDEIKYNVDGLSREQAQDQEYFRYLTQVVSELEKDDDFKNVLHNATEEEIRTGKIAEKMELVGHHVRYSM